MWCTATAGTPRDRAIGAPHRCTHQQGADQARACRVGHAVDVLAGTAGLRQAFIEQRQQLAHMVARGDFRHHAAVFGVDMGLRIEGMRQQAPLAVINGNPGLIA